MMNVLNILASVGLVVGLIATGVGAVAAMDPEGRGGNYILAGLFGLIVAVACAVYLVIIALRAWAA